MVHGSNDGGALWIFSFCYNSLSWSWAEFPLHLLCLWALASSSSSSRHIEDFSFRAPLAELERSLVRISADMCLQYVMELDTGCEECLGFCVNVCVDNEYHFVVVLSSVTIHMTFVHDSHLCWSDVKLMVECVQLLQTDHWETLARTDGWPEAKTHQELLSWVAQLDIFVFSLFILMKL